MNSLIEVINKYGIEAVLSALNALKDSMELHNIHGNAKAALTEQELNAIIKKLQERENEL